MRVRLASGSPRRLELLHQLGTLRSMSVPVILLKSVAITLKKL